MSIKLACRACEHKIAKDGLEVFSRRPPSCECGNFTFPHAHRGRPGAATAVPYKCAYCQKALSFVDTNSATVDAVSFNAPCPRCQQDADEKADRAVKSAIVFHDCGRPN